MKKALLWVRPNPSQGMIHQKNWCAEFAKGLMKHGWSVVLTDDMQDCDLFCIWGTRRKEVISAVKNMNIPICVIERGFIGDRFENCMIGLGGNINGAASYPWIKNEPDRFNKFKKLLEPLKTIHNKKALLIGQVYGDASIKHLNADEIYTRLNNELQSNGWSVLFRPHPNNRRDYVKLKNVTYVNGDLYDNFNEVSLVVTVNSNTGVDSVLYGVPTVTVDNVAMSWDVTLHTVPHVTNTMEQFYSFDRQKWANELAYKQFNKEEMRTGLCFDLIKQYI